MNKIFKYVLMLIMGILVFAQAFFINKINFEKDIKVYKDVKKNISKPKSLKEINDELDCLKEKNILSANQINDKWYVKIKIAGNKEDLLGEMSKLKKYEISNYIINKTKEENSIILEISSQKEI